MRTALVFTPRFPMILNTWFGKVMWRNLLWKFSLFTVKEEALFSIDEKGEWKLEVLL